MLQMSSAFKARKRCLLANYKLPTTVPEGDGFSDLDEAWQDTTIEILEIVELSDGLLRYSLSKESEMVYLSICDRWQNISFLRNSVSIDGSLSLTWVRILFVLFQLLYFVCSKYFLYQEITLETSPKRKITSSPVM